MKLIKLFFLTAVVVFLFNSCSEDDNLATNEIDLSLDSKKGLDSEVNFRTLTGRVGSINLPLSLSSIIKPSGSNCDDNSCDSSPIWPQLLDSSDNFITQPLRDNRTYKIWPNFILCGNSCPWPDNIDILLVDESNNPVLTIAENFSTLQFPYEWNVECGTSTSLTGTYRIAFQDVSNTYPISYDIDTYEFDSSGTGNLPNGTVGFYRRWTNSLLFAPLQEENIIFTWDNRLKIQLDLPNNGFDITNFNNLSIVPPYQQGSNEFTIQIPSLASPLDPSIGSFDIKYENTDGCTEYNTLYFGDCRSYCLTNDL